MTATKSEEKEQEPSDERVGSELDPPPVFQYLTCSCASTDDDTPSLNRQIAFEQFPEGEHSVSSQISSTDARLSVLASSLKYLTKPIKLIPPEVIISLGFFPKYDSEFEFTPLNEETFTRCVAVSHRWTNPTNSRSDLDVQWIIEKWSTFNLSNVEGPLLFYDYSSLPQRRENGEFDPEEYLTFKAGLEMIDHIFSRKTIIIPTQGYAFRFWCYAELFIAEYNSSRVSPLPIDEPAPRDLKIIDNAIDLVSKEIIGFAIFASNRERVHLYIGANLRSIRTLSWADRRLLSEHVLGIHKMDLSSRRVILHQLVEKRKIVVDIIRARFRQCTLLYKSDQPYLDNMLNRYLDREAPSSDLLKEQYQATPGINPP